MAIKQRNESMNPAPVRQVIFDFFVILTVSYRHSEQAEALPALRSLSEGGSKVEGAAQWSRGIY